MMLQLYSVHDKAVNAFLTPFFARSKAEAMRSFMDAVSDKDHQFARHPHDYALCLVGEFDDVSGMLSYLDKGPERVISALECFPDSVESSAVRLGERPRAVG